jgi:hypothetical protein
MPNDLPPPSVSIQTTNQSGGSNIGIQYNFAAPVRKITDEQKDLFVRAITNPRSPGNISIRLENSDGEIQMFGSQLMQLFDAAKLVPLTISTPMAGMMPSFPDGITIGVKDPSHAPLNAQLIAKGFRQMNLSFRVGIDPSMQSDAVVILVGKAPQK